MSAHAANVLPTQQPSQKPDLDRDIALLDRRMATWRMLKTMRRLRDEACSAQLPTDQVTS